MEQTLDKIIERATLLVEALPYLNRYAGKIIIIKYGGNAMNDPAIMRTIMQDVAALKIVGVHPVIVHGGGPEINAMLKRLDIPSRFENGLRVTDAAAMEVVQMVLAGKINKNLTAMLNTMGVKAVGLCGKDGGLIRVEKMPARDGVDLGYVGRIVSIDTSVIEAVQQNFIPVIASVGTDAFGDGYNVNADTAAGAIGGALGAEKLMFLTDIDGIRADEKRPETLIKYITVPEIRAMIGDGRISGGMIPKVNSCIYAIEKGVSNVLIINGTIPHSILLELFTDSGIGTMVLPE